MEPSTTSSQLRALTRSRDIGVLRMHRWRMIPETLGCNLNQPKISFHSFTATRCTDYSNSFAQSPLAPQLNISNINSFPRPLWVTYFGRLLLAAACRHHRPAGWFGRDGRWATRLGVLGATGTHGTCHWSF
jgi:hypothetical protein